MNGQYAQAYVEALSCHRATKTRPKTKGLLAKTIGLHVLYHFWYISPTFSAKHDKISKVKVVTIMLSL